MFTITQDDLTKRVLEMLPTDEFRQRFQVVQPFNLDRIPLMVFFLGTGFSGKSEIAFQLGERMNISTILQTDLVLALMAEEGSGLGRGLWDETELPAAEFISELAALSDRVAVSIEGDISKTLSDGKPLIVEGIHLTPERVIGLCGSNAINRLDGFPRAWFRPRRVDKAGFCFLFLITRTEHDIRSAIASQSFADDFQGDLEVMARNALSFQEMLVAQFPPSLVINASELEPVDVVQRLILDQLTEWYAGRPR